MLICCPSGGGVQGGTNSWENLVTCCSKCNSLKGSKTLQELKWKLKSKPRVRGPASPQANSWAGARLAEAAMSTELRADGLDLPIGRCVLAVQCIHVWGRACTACVSSPQAALGKLAQTVLADLSRVAVAGRTRCSQRSWLHAIRWL